MTIKKTLKIALPAVLLAAGATAFADVTLSNGGGTISWDEFVSKINNPSAIKGTVSQEVETAWQTAKKTYQGFETALAQKIQAVSDAQDTYDSKSRERTGLISDRDKLQSQLDKKNEQLRNDKAQLALLTQNASTLETRITNTSNSIATNEGKITTNQNRIDLLEVSLIPSCYTETKKPIGWIAEAKKKADSMTDAMVEWIEVSTDNKEKTVYVQFRTIKLVKYAIIAFDEDILVTDNKGNKPEKVTAFGFLDFVANKSVSKVLLDLGENHYKGGSGETAGLLPVAFDKTEPEITFVNAYEALEALEKQDEYIVTEKAVNDQDKLNKYELEKTTLEQENITLGNTIITLRGQLGNETDVTGNSFYAQLATINASIGTLNNEITTLEGDNGDIKKLEGQISGYQTQIDGINLTTLNQNIETAKGEQTIAQENLDKAKPAYDAAKTTYDEAVKNADDAEKAKYNTVTLTDDVNATKPVTADYAGVIRGEKHVINVAIPSTESQTTLFNHFSGRVTNAAINGTLADDINGARFSNVAVWTGSAGRFYNDQGEKVQVNGSDNLTFPNVGYKAREFFGVDFGTSKLVAKTATTTVYDLAVYDNAVLTKPTQRYATTNGNKFTYSGGATVEIPTNKFAVVADADFEELATATNVNFDVANVIYRDADGNYVSKKVTIEDRQDFYCPVDVTTSDLNYNRNFVQGQNAICLPFDLTGNVKSELRSKIDMVCEYERETKERFWFTAIEGTILANTPALLVAKEAFTLTANDLGSVMIKQTPVSQLEKVASRNATDESCAYGTLKRVGIGEFAGEDNVDYVYGLHTDGNFRHAGEGAVFPALRMVIGTVMEPNKLETESVRRIGVRDEYGNDITDDLAGVNSVVADGKLLNIIGGQGEITITSDVNYGKIDVYALDGKVVATTNVTEGSTSIRVQAGVYVVMGQKVMVK